MPIEPDQIPDKIKELQENGFCVLKDHFPLPLLHHCREAFQPILLRYIEEHRDQPNRGPHRHFVPMPFDAPCFAPEFFFNPIVLQIARSVMDERIVADQWACDAPMKGSEYQGIHADYQRSLFPELPDLALPIYMLVVSFGLLDIRPEHGPIEIAPGTHRMARAEALHAVEQGVISLQPIPLALSDVLIRHPWALHRGTPNKTDVPRALLTIRYVRRWYADFSREVRAIPKAVWASLTPEQQTMMRYPVAE